MSGVLDFATGGLSSILPDFISKPMDKLVGQGKLGDLMGAVASPITGVTGGLLNAVGMDKNLATLVNPSTAFMGAQVDKVIEENIEQPVAQQKAMVAEAQRQASEQGKRIKEARKAADDSEKAYDAASDRDKARLRQIRLQSKNRGRQSTILTENIGDIGGFSKRNLVGS